MSARRFFFFSFPWKCNAEWGWSVPVIFIAGYGFITNNASKFILFVLWSYSFLFIKESLQLKMGDSRLPLFRHKICSRHTLLSSYTQRTSTRIKTSGMSLPHEASFCSTLLIISPRLYQGKKNQVRCVILSQNFLLYHFSRK